MSLGELIPDGTRLVDASVGLPGHIRWQRPDGTTGMLHFSVPEPRQTCDEGAMTRLDRVCVFADRAATVAELREIAKKWVAHYGHPVEVDERPPQGRYAPDKITI